MRFFTALSLAALFALTGCDQLTATVQGVSVLTRTPDLSRDAVGMDANLAQYLPFGDLSEQAGVGLFAGLAQKESATSTATPEPLPGALVRLEWDGGVVDVCEITDQGAEGTYSATNIPSNDCGDANLEYVDNVEYTTTFETGADLYTTT